MALMRKEKRDLRTNPDVHLMSPFLFAVCGPVPRDEEASLH